MGNFMRKEESPKIEKRPLSKEKVKKDSNHSEKGKRKKMTTAEMTSKKKKTQTGHDMSPSPETVTTVEGNDDTDQYSDDSHEGKNWASIFSREELTPTEKLKQRLSLISKWSIEDTRAYREGYPGKVEMKNKRDNYLFYTNCITSKPDGDKINDILDYWFGEYEKLEKHHGYIQWLFPIRESGMNWYAQELQLHEIEKMKADPEIMKRLIRSYEMMLDFFGLKLKDPDTGEIERADHWQERLTFLNRSYHNYLRITRILKCLGEFGREHMKFPFVRFMLNEAIHERTIPNAAKSCVEYWAYTLRNKDERQKILDEVEVFMNSDPDSSPPSSPGEQSPPQSPQETSPQGSKAGAVSSSTTTTTTTKSPTKSQGHSPRDTKDDPKSQTQGSSSSTPQTQPYPLDSQPQTASSPKQLSETLVDVEDNSQKSTDQSNTDPSMVSWEQGSSDRAPDSNVANGSRSSKGAAESNSANGQCSDDHAPVSVDSSGNDGSVGKTSPDATVDKNTGQSKEQLSPDQQSPPSHV